MVFIPNPRLGEELMADQDFRDGLAATAGADVSHRAEDLAVRIMPRQSQAFEVSSDEDGVRVVNTDYGAAIAEWGSRNNPPYAPLRRAVREAGLRLEEAPKPAG